MAEIIIGNLDDWVVENLKRRAELAGRTLEAEVRQLLTNSVQYDWVRRAELRASYGREFPDPTNLIPEARER